MIFAQSALQSASHASDSAGIASVRCCIPLNFAFNLIVAQGMLVFDLLCSVLCCRFNRWCQLTCRPWTSYHHHLNTIANITRSKQSSMLCQLYCRVTSHLSRAFYICLISIRYIRNNRDSLFQGTIIQGLRRFYQSQTNPELPRVQRHIRKRASTLA